MHPDIRFDRDDVVINKIAFADGPFVLVAIHHVIEVGGGVRGGSGGQADLDRVKVVERLPPDRKLGRGVSAMALVGDDEVKCVDGNVELLRVLIDILVAEPEDGVPAKEVDCHPLDRRDESRSSPKSREGGFASGWMMQIDPAARLIWPVYPHNPYNPLRCVRSEQHSRRAWGPQPGGARRRAVCVGKVPRFFANAQRQNSRPRH